MSIQSTDNVDLAALVLKYLALDQRHRRPRSDSDDININAAVKRISQRRMWIRLLLHLHTSHAFTWAFHAQANCRNVNSTHLSSTQVEVLHLPIVCRQDQDNFSAGRTAVTSLLLFSREKVAYKTCLLYTSDAADD